jgi:hypothetical protein
LKKGTKPHTDGWDTSDKVWSHMVLHLTHREGGFGGTFNDVTKDSKFLSDYNCRETLSQSQVNVGGGGGLRTQDGVSQQEEASPLSIPQLNNLFETSFVRDENSVSNSVVTVIPSQHHRVTQQIPVHSGYC